MGRSERAKSVMKQDSGLRIELINTLMDPIGWKGMASVPIELLWNLETLIAQERRKAKIEVLEKPILLELHIKQSQDYKQGFRDAVEQVESYRKDKLAELKEDKERKQ